MPVFAVGDVLEPCDDVTMFIRLLHGDMGHAMVFISPMPMLLSWLDIYDISRPDSFRRAPAATDIANAVGDI